ncbi:MAG: phosphatidylserine decarboxylase [Bacteroidia bacterium]|nr:phosphatidylserine decarboxylase [Bacteroidia bacterium]
MALIRLHHEGKKLIWGIALGGVGIITLVALLYPNWKVLVSLTGLWIGIMGFVAYFFRYPWRECSAQSNFLYAPCDGKVVEVKSTFEPRHFYKPMQQISIFMSPLNVHVNWAPAAGKVVKYQYSPGTYLVAWHPKASLLNEQSFLAIEEAPDKRYYALRQIAGALARRVCTYIIEGEEVQPGQEIGFIRFGSRVDVLVPESAEVLVKPGQKVRGCLTPIARW